MLYAHRYIRFLLSFQLLCLSSAIFFGVPDLQTLLLRLLREDPDYSPADDHKWITLIQNTFSLALIGYKFFAIVCGFVLDYSGSKVVGLFGQAMLAAGFLIMSAVNAGSGWWTIRVGMYLMAAASTPTWMSVLWIPQIFPDRKNLLISVLGAAGNVAQGLILMGWVVFHDRVGGSVRRVFYYEVVIVVFQMIIIFLYWPMKVEATVAYAIRQRANEKAVSKRKRLSLETLECAELDEKRGQTDEKIRERLTTLSIEIHAEDKKLLYFKYHDLSVWEQLKTPHIWVFAICLCTFLIAKTAYLNSLNLILRSIEGSTNAWVEKHAHLYQYIGTPTAVIVGLAIGYFGDKVSVLIFCTFNCFSGAAAFLCFFFAENYVVGSRELTVLLCASFFLFAVFNSYVLSSTYAFLSHYYGFKNLGVLSGLISIVASFSVYTEILLRMVFLEGGKNNFRAFTLTSAVILVLGSLSPLCIMLVLPSPVKKIPPLRPPPRQMMKEFFAAKEHKEHIGAYVGFCNLAPQYTCPRCGRMECSCRLVQKERDYYQKTGVDPIGKLDEEMKRHSISDDELDLITTGPHSVCEDKIEESAA